MRPAKFVFEPYREAERKVKIARKRGFNVNTKYGSLTFPKSYVEDNRLEGKMVKWFIDLNKNALGWKILGESTEKLEDLEGYIPVKKQVTSGLYKFSIARVLSTFQFKEDCVFKDLEVEKHIEMQSTFYSGTIHYLVLDDPQPYVARSPRKKKEATETHATTT